jgi:hypothetical protein
MTDSDLCDPNTLVDLNLAPEERNLLRRGLLEWGGPTRCTEELAIAMGFGGLSALRSEGRRIANLVRAGTALTRLDLLRALLATEFVFMSDSMGSGADWKSTVGMSDADTISVLRRLQRRTTKPVLCLVGNGLGSR